MPSDMTGAVEAWFVDSGGYTILSPHVQSQNGCANFPYKISDSNVGFRVDVFFDDITGVEESDFTCVGGTISSFQTDTSDNKAVIVITPSNANNVCYLLYNGFIVFVGNYSD